RTWISLGIKEGGGQAAGFPKFTTGWNVDGATTRSRGRPIGPPPAPSRASHWTPKRRRKAGPHSTKRCGEVGTPHARPDPGAGPPLRQRHGRHRLGGDRRTLRGRDSRPHGTDVRLPRPHLGAP